MMLIMLTQTVGVVSGRGLRQWVWSVYLEAGPQTVGVVSSVAAVTQQHVVSVSFASADATASVEDGARPEDASLQTGQVDKHLDTQIII